MALCTQADVEAKLQWDITAEPDPTVTALIADAQATMEAYLGRPLESATRTQVFDGGRYALFLKVWPVTGITSITEAGEALTSDDYRFKPNGRLLRTNTSGFPIPWRTSKPQDITVVYTGGFLAEESSSSSSSSSVSDMFHAQALEHLGSICAEIVARAFRKGADNAATPAGAAGGIQSVSLEGSDTVSYATGGGAAESLAGGSLQFVFLTDEEKAQLDRYRGLPTGFA